jgi:hypothetical protein
MKTIAASGALYTFIAFLAFIMIAMNSAFGYILSDMVRFSSSFSSAYDADTVIYRP